MNKDAKKIKKSTNENADAYVIYDEKEIEYLDENNNVIGYEKISFIKFFIVSVLKLF